MMLDQLSVFEVASKKKNYIIEMRSSCLKINKCLLFDKKKIHSFSHVLPKAKIRLSSVQRCVEIHFCSLIFINFELWIFPLNWISSNFHILSQLGQKKNTQSQKQHLSDWFSSKNLCGFTFQLNKYFRNGHECSHLTYNEQNISPTIYCK